MITAIVLTPPSLYFVLVMYSLVQKKKNLFVLLISIELQ